MKLYKVTIQMMVVAASKEDAQHICDDVDIYSCDFYAEEVTAIDKCLLEWEDARPFGDQGSDDFTCAEIIDSL